MSFMFAARASEPAGLLLGDVQALPRGLAVDIVTGKTRHSVRSVKIPRAADPECCPVAAWAAWRERLHAVDAVYAVYADPAGPAFRAVARWGNVGGAMSPDAVTQAVARVAERSGIPIRWTGHSLRSGLASSARRSGRDAIAVADQGGWARHSRSVLGYMRRDDGWEDNAAAGLL